MDLESFEHGRHAGCLDADDANFRASFFHGTGDATDEASAANGNHDRLKIRHLLENLESDGSVPRNDCGIIERVDESQMLAFGETTGFLVGLIIPVPVQDDVSAEFLGRVDLTSGVITGMTILAEMPLLRAWKATPWA